jgi:hypothetical protein
MLAATRGEFTRTRFLPALGRPVARRFCRGGGSSDQDERSAAAGLQFGPDMCGGRFGNLFEQRDWGALGANDGTGLVAGGQVGCNYQISTWAFGIERRRRTVGYFCNPCRSGERRAH